MNNIYLLYGYSYLFFHLSTEQGKLKKVKSATIATTKGNKENIWQFTMHNFIILTNILGESQKV